MAFDITSKHPVYRRFSPAWELMRTAFDGEDAIKERDTGSTRDKKYLPMKSGHVGISDPYKRETAYEAYKMRAEFPELVAPTVRGAVGVMLDKPPTISLPRALEPLRENATRDGMPLDALHRRVAIETMTMGRYGILPGIADGVPYLAGYNAESIINWDSSGAKADYVVLDETGHERNRDTGEWVEVERFRECFVEGGRFGAREWKKVGKDWVVDEVVEAATPQRRPLDFLPFVFIDTNDLTANPDDVPLYGLAKLAVRIYRLDADYTFALHMTSEPTPVAIGFENGRHEDVPQTLGSSKMWILPPGGDAKYLEFSGPGLEAQRQAIQDTLARAAVFGAQIMTDNGRGAESGDALRLRLGNQTSTLKSIAKTSAAGIERALKNVAIWMGENPDEVVVEPVTDFFEENLSAQELTAVVAGWQAGAYSFPTMFSRLQRGGMFPPDAKAEDELKLIDEDDPGFGSDADALAAMTPPAAPAE